ncbi:hypothetical protein LOK49_LG12G00852 [Camellia lanceoleosa]|uniref:Uncharacterized protein n=1 Tax=Camellia lanceoleosa TaxID=1840588 RepID=A0ACC0FTZ0_9ERIC|nr:hypothetical protein LOK49_LG12G00852 [Camellia lanceoleosa]
MTVNKESRFLASSHGSSCLCDLGLSSSLPFSSDFSVTTCLWMIGDIGLKHMEFILDIIPGLITILKDGTPAVARQTITCGIDLFRSTLVKVAIQGLYSSELDNSLESSWAWVLKFRDEIYFIAFQPGSDGTRLLIKFVEATILLYTSDPSGSSEPPPHQAFEGKFLEFNISWLRGGHPVLNVGDLSIEASQGLGLLLDQLRFPIVKSLSNSMIIVLINRRFSSTFFFLSLGICFFTVQNCQPYLIMYCIPMIHENNCMSPFSLVTLYFLLFLSEQLLKLGLLTHPLSLGYIY